MNNIEDKTRITTQEAAYWYLRFTEDPHMSEGGRRLFLRWLKKTPENMAEILRVADLDGSFRRIDLLSALEALQNCPKFLEGARLRSKERAALSVAYLQHLKAKHLFPKLAIGFAGAGFSVAAILTGKTQMFLVSVLLLTLLGLFIVKELVLKYRISRGFYAGNAIEARDLIQFIIEQGDDLDFTDGSGLRRPTLISHPDDRALCREDIPAGVPAK